MVLFFILFFTSVLFHFGPVKTIMFFLMVIFALFTSDTKHMSGSDTPAKIYFL